MCKPQLRAATFDLDDTLLRQDKTVSEYTRSVLDRCRKAGILVVLATARSEQGAARIIQLVKPDAVISSGGALVRCGDTVVHRCVLPAETVSALLAEAVRSPALLNISLRTDTGTYVTWDTPSSPDYAHAVHDDFRTPHFEDAYKISIELSSPDAAKALADRFPICGMLAFSGNNWYRFTHRDTSKMNGIRALAKHLSLEISQIAAFGDDYSDIDMLSGCGIGIAMGNAIDAVKAVADDVCDTNDRDGAAKWLGAYLFHA